MAGMTSGGPGNPAPGKVYMGRVRGLRQGGGRPKPINPANPQDVTSGLTMSNPQVGNIPVGGGSNPMAAAASNSKPPLGSGARFKNLTDQLSHRPGVHNPAKLAAFIGQKKYGAKKMGAMAAKGRGR